MHKPLAISVDMGNGLGYTLLDDHPLWGGISLNAWNHRFGDNQIVIAPRAYVNYNFCNCDPGNFWVGVSYSDQIGTRHDCIIDKHRLLALTLGATANLNSKFRLSSWVNAVGFHDDLIYNSATNTRVFDSTANNRTILEFGGLMLTYVF